jgi:hypothetical protein
MQVMQVVQVVQFKTCRTAEPQNSITFSAISHQLPSPGPLLFAPRPGPCAL